MLRSAVFPMFRKLARSLADGPADFADRWSAVPASAARGAAEPLAASPDDVSREEATKRAAIRRLVCVPLAREGQTAFDAGAPAVPFVPSASILPSSPPVTFNERFPKSYRPWARLRPRRDR